MVARCLVFLALAHALFAQLNGALLSDPRQFMSRKLLHNPEKTLAKTLSITISEAARFKRTYFSKYPEIKSWHERIWLDLLRDGKVSNAFGYHIYHFGRLTENDLKNYVAWIPQSTVALTINKCWARLEDTVAEAIVLLQVHDELIYQIPSVSLPHLKPSIREAFHIRIPYPDPLYIPAGLKTSTKSWGDVKTESWEG